MTLDDLLTPTEMRVLVLVADGARNKTMASALAVTDSTVKSHVKAIIRKLRVDNRTQAALTYWRLTGGLAPSPSAASPDDIRAAGWGVAIHNDYRLGGLHNTFWLFVKDGFAMKGEGMSDAAALNEVRTQIGLPTKE